MNKCKSLEMKHLRLLLLLAALMPGAAFSQQPNREFLLNKGMVTLVDHTENSAFTVSFRGDSVQDADHQNLFLVKGSDVKMYQVTRFPIPDKMSFMKYDKPFERDLLSHFYRFEYWYLRDTVLKQDFDNVTQYFTNQHGKLFLLWHYDMPKEVTAKERAEIRDKSETGGIVESQLYILFVTGKYVTMVNMPLESRAQKSKMISYLKTYVANSVRIYPFGIEVDFLDQQLQHIVEGMPLRLADSTRLVQFEVPFWLNVSRNQRHRLVGAFPDVNNFSDLLLFETYDRTNAPSFDDFMQQTFQAGNVDRYKEIPVRDAKMRRYRVEFTLRNGAKAVGEHLYLKVACCYSLVSFTASYGTYKKNKGRWEEFIKGIRLH